MLDRIFAGQLPIIDGDGDVAEICRLTCLERGVRVASASQAVSLPVLRVEGTSLALEWGEQL